MAYYQVLGTGGGPNKPVKAVAVANVSIGVLGPGITTLDGFTLTSGDPILLTNQTTKSENGVWIWLGSATQMTRPPSALDQYAHLNVLDNNTLIPITNGNSAGSVWNIHPAQKVTVDTDPHAIVQVNLPPVQARVATVADITLSSPGTTIDGVTMAVGDVVLVKAQTSGGGAADNGLYFFNVSVRRTASPRGREINRGRA